MQPRLPTLDPDASASSPEAQAEEDAVAAGLARLSGVAPEDGYLPAAEAAVRAFPRSPELLIFATFAALLDRRPRRAEIYLKRFSRYFVGGGIEPLLRAIWLQQMGRGRAACHELARARIFHWRSAAPLLPGKGRHDTWLRDRFADLEASLDLRKESRRSASNGLRPAPAAARAGRTPAAAAAPVPPGASLARLPLEIPIRFQSEWSLPAGPGRGAQPAEAGAWFEVRRQWLQLGLAQGFDELLCLAHLPGFEPMTHQLETARKVLQQFRGRALLADEVGLGKTIEAGLVLKEYIVRGLVERVLILTPAALVGQWREEMASKFGLEFVTTQDALVRENPENFWDRPRIVASLPLARRAEHAERLTRRAFDAVVVDEAHHLRDRGGQSYRLVDGLNKRFLLLLSATPVQNSLIELYTLLTLLQPGIFKTLRQFRAEYTVSGHPRRPANPDRLRELMRGAMIRNTRAAAALGLPRRHAATLVAKPDPPERHAYEATLLQARLAAATNPEDGEHRLALRHLLGAGGSSPAAALQAARACAARHPNDAGWTALVEAWRVQRGGAKQTRLLELLQRNPTEKKLVFVRYAETLASLAEQLAAAGISFACFDASLSGAQKDEAIARFRDHVSVLLSTESGGEGRNLQFCNTVVNFDVPWNPMLIEQRIGRVDRIGQQREVYVFNLVSEGTIEERVLKLLEEKIALFELVMGETSAILGALEAEGDFAELVLQAWLESTDAGHAAALVALGDRLAAARAGYEESKAFDETLFGEDFARV